MPSLAQQLISEEFRRSDSSDTEGRAAFRVCEKLRGPLSTFAGVAGYRALLSRALALAKAEVPWLSRLQVTPEGSILPSAELEGRLIREEANKGGTALVKHVIGLLITFIGETLTLRLIHEVWPKATFKNLHNGD